MLDRNEYEAIQETYRERIQRLESVAEQKPLSEGWRYYWMGFTVGLGVATLGALLDFRQPWFQPVPAPADWMRTPASARNPMRGAGTGQGPLLRKKQELKAAPAMPPAIQQRGPVR